MNSPSPTGMNLVDALTTLNQFRNQAVVIPTMGAAREWPRISNHPLDLVYVPSSMGQAPALGLGLALACPEQRVIIINGDGCLLMNLGTLVTISAEAPSNYILVVIENGVYEVTGRQPTAANPSIRPVDSQVDIVEMARAAGFKNAHRFCDLETWKTEVKSVLQEEGPVFISLECVPCSGDASITSPGPMRERLPRFQRALTE